MSKPTVHKYCRFCAEDISETSDAFRHRVGLCTPSKTEVEACIETLEIEDVREKEAIRNFWERERQKSRAIQVRWNWLTGVIVTVCIVTAGYMLAVLLHPAIRWDW